MIILSALLYLLSRHPIWIAMGAAAITMLVVAVAVWTQSVPLLCVGFIPFIFAFVNIFVASRINAIFLNKFGVVGSAVITRARRTDSRLNEELIYAYDTVLRTSDQHDIKLALDSMTLSIYPGGPEAGIPPAGERFIAKYIPGFERNIVIMSDVSAFGKRSVMELAMADINQARLQFEASPHNEAFLREFREILESFLSTYGSSAPPVLARRYRAQLRDLDRQRPMKEDEGV